MNNFWKSFLCVLACVLFCAVSFFTGYFFRDTVKIKQSSEINASCSLKTADTTAPNYSYSGSNIYLPVAILNNPYVDINQLSSVEVRCFTFWLNKSIEESPNAIFQIYVYGFDGYSVFNTAYDTWSAPLSLYDYRNQKHIVFGYMIQSSFNFNVVSFSLTTGSSFYGNSDFASTNVYFYDNNGNYIQFTFGNDYSDNFPFLDNRKYYLSSNFSDNDFYNQGYSTGYFDGVTNGSEESFNTGYDYGYNDGVIAGYNDGVNATNTYTFSNLLTAVVNAPVSVFTNLLDFNIMGFNLLSLVAGLLTLGLIVLIIKLCLGGK